MYLMYILESQYTKKWTSKIETEIKELDLPVIPQTQHDYNEKD